MSSSKRRSKFFITIRKSVNIFADLIVENCVITELKAVENLLKVHEAQLLNYLKATEIEVGLLLNFGTTAEYRRKVFNNTRKNLKDVLLNP